MMKTAILTRVIMVAVPPCKDSKPDARYVRSILAHLDIANELTIVNHDGKPIDDDLHQKLNLEYPKKEDAEE